MSLQNITSVISSRSPLILTLMASSLVLSGCVAVGLAAGAGAAVGVSAAKEGGLSGTVTDESIRIKISETWFQRDVNMFRKLNLTVNQGRVLVTGVVQKPEDRVEAIRMAWQPKGVKQVINEVRVGDAAGFGSYAQDTWISGQLRTSLTFDKYVQSINYSIETVQGTVYLMGVAQNQRELDRAIGIAKRIKGVKEVISYVKLAGEQTAGDGAGAQPVTSVQSSPVSVQSTQSGLNQPTPLMADEQMPMGQDDMSGGYTAPSSSGPSSVQSEVLPP